LFISSLSAPQVQLDISRSQPFQRAVVLFCTAVIDFINDRFSLMVPNPTFELVRWSSP
jgi:hypothetical protein